MILLVAATELEIPHFIHTSYDSVSILITGVGAPAAMYQLQKKVDAGNYNLVIQAGIAGSFSNEIGIGEVVLVKQDCFGDIGAEEKNGFSSVFDMGLANDSTPPFTNGWLVNDNPYLKSSSLKLVKAITVNKVSDSPHQKQQMIDVWNPEIETMEGAALHYVCLMENIPFLQLRSISNYAGDRNKANWKIEESVSNMNMELKKIIAFSQYSSS